jgi:predicted phage terminase large subunit-like protein
MNAHNPLSVYDAKKLYAQESFIEFCKFVRPKFEVNWHHEVICEHLQSWIKKDIPRLMLFAPPRHGKSELVSRCLPAFLFGRDPDAQIISTSHTASLANELACDVQTIIDSEAYRELFPGTRLKRTGTKSKRTDYRAANRFSVVGRRGRFFCCGVGGPIVGRGFEFGIIDDPIANREAAYSPIQRQKINRWYPTQFATRMLPKACILLMHQRWHVGDLAGLLRDLQSKDPNADHWTILSFPAIAEHPLAEFDHRKPGEALWPSRYPLEYLRSRKAENTETDWLAIYQQRPTADGGNHFMTDWFDTFWVERSTDRIAIRKRGNQWYEWLKSDCSLFGIVDPAATNKPSSDHTAMGAFLQTPDGDLCVLNILRERIAIDQIPRRIKRFAQDHSLTWMGVEANGFQVTLVNEARRIKACPLRELSHKGRGKLVRATPSIIHASNGQVVLPQEAAWKRGFLDRLAQFTGLEGDEDDEVDVLAYAVLEMSTRDGTGMPREDKTEDRPASGLPTVPRPPRRDLFGS